MKKLLAFILAMLMLGTVLAVGASATDGEETPEEYTVTFYSSYSTVFETQTKIEGEDLKLSTAKPSQSGATFKGWSTSYYSNTVDYKPGDMYTEDADLNLYAVWQYKSIKIPSKFSFDFYNFMHNGLNPLAYLWIPFELMLRFVLMGEFWMQPYSFARQILGFPGLPLINLRFGNNYVRIGAAEAELPAELA